MEDTCGQSRVVSLSYNFIKVNLTISVRLIEKYVKIWADYYREKIQGIF